MSARCPGPPCFRRATATQLEPGPECLRGRPKRTQRCFAASRLARSARESGPARARLCLVERLQHLALMGNLYRRYRLGSAESLTSQAGFTKDGWPGQRSGHDRLHWGCCRRFFARVHNGSSSTPRTIRSRLTSTWSVKGSRPSFGLIRFVWKIVAGSGGSRFDRSKGWSRTTRGSILDQPAGRRVPRHPPNGRKNRRAETARPI